MTILTISDAVAVATIISAAQRTAPVARLMDNGDVIYGTARHICHDENGGFLRSDEDVRSGMLRVTTVTGFEAFWPVTDLIPLVRSGEFCVDVRP